MKRSRFTAALYLLVVFVSGVLVGGLGQRLYSAKSVSADRASGVPRRTPEEYRRQYIEEMTERLKLNLNQVTKINQILDDTKARVHEVRQRVDPEFKQIHRDQITHIEAILSEPQREEYAKLRQERELRRKQEKQQEKKSGYPPGM